LIKRVGDAPIGRVVGTARVPITWAPCHLGGRRPWFICSVRMNGQYCGRRVALLYAAGELFACRCCCGLAYASQQKDLLVRNVSRSAKIRARLGALLVCGPLKGSTRAI
jgi:hypothetical protein